MEDDSDKTIVVNYVLNGTELTLKVTPEQERVYRKAGGLLQKRSLELQSKYNPHASSLQIANLLAIEAMVEALILQDEYKSFQDEINGYLNDLNGNVA